MKAPRWILGALLVAPMLASAGRPQRSHDRQETEDAWVFETTWKDAGGSTHTVSYQLPRDAIDDDRAERTFLRRRELNEHVVGAVRAFGRTKKAVKVTARIEDGGVRISVSAKDRKRAKQVLERAEAVRDEATDEWLAEHRFFRRDDGKISFDHARLVADYADRLTPVAEALTADTSGRREYVERALSFVQAVPYEARKRKGGDPGYRRPLALLFRNRGDCDSKAVLFLGLVRAAYPDTELAVVYIPGHALTGVGLPARDGDETFTAGEVELLYAEPVGPGLHPLGQPAPENRKAGRKGDVHLVP